MFARCTQLVSYDCRGREQARSCLQLPGFSVHGLQLLSQVDIEFLSAVQKGEFYHIKSELILSSASANAGLTNFSGEVAGTDEESARTHRVGVSWSGSTQLR